MKNEPVDSETFNLKATVWESLAAELARREKLALRRSLQVVPDHTLDLASNDYLGLATHPEVVEAAREAASKHGAGARASRLVSGNFELLIQLETALARFKKCEAALVFPSGFSANLGLIGALTRSPNDHFFCHKRNHASLIDACRLAQSQGAWLRYFESNEKLKSLLEKAPKHRKYIVVDAVFSMDGDLCDLPTLLELAREFDAIILLDDAHGTGTLGATGHGASEHFGITDERIVQIGTLSKALGSQGGFVAGPQVLIDFLVNAARSFIYTTGLNPAAVGAALKSLEIIEREPQRVEACRCNARILAMQLQELGYDARLTPSPILPVIVGEAEDAVALSNRLKETGLWCPAIRPPTVAKGTARLRLTANAGWDEETLERIVGVFTAESQRESGGEEEIGSGG